MLNPYQALPWFKELKNVEATVVGLGGLGSPLVILLRNFGIDITVFDPDKVEARNVYSQLHSSSDINRYKTDASRKLLRYLGSDTAYRFKKLKFERLSFCKPYVFSCTDNMKARKDLFNAWRLNPNKELFIDVRLSVESFQIIMVTKDDYGWYEKTIWSDDLIPEAQCTLKQTPHIAAIAASMMISTFTNYLWNIPQDRLLLFNGITRSLIAQDVEIIYSPENEEEE